ncbi:MAG: rod shape-determining protein MreC [Desulfobacteraceae bacterium]|nr:rod shape-determining protein MreC [Desulfobacteraceae bacterium]
MFSKKMMVAVGAVVLISLYIIVFSFAYLRHSTVGDVATRTALFLVSPFQTAFSSSMHFMDDIWTHYFFLISVSKENDELKKKLAQAISKNNECREIELSNDRLVEFVKLKQQSPFQLEAAQVIARDSSPWYKTIIINKGTDDGITAGCPVIVFKGIVGYVLTASSSDAKVLLIIDRNSSVDALVQRTRARGLAQGMTRGLCRFEFALRKRDIKIGDNVVSSGFDGIYPKGLRIGYISKVIRRNSGLFQDVELTPYVDFTTLEEVMIILCAPPQDNVGN